ncbi:MAG TPA: beta-galactosidase [Patescibacteria group bacterium]|nr:beta-galactosidase [Patescibacteria group bacterium]
MNKIKCKKIKIIIISLVILTALIGSVLSLYFADFSRSDFSLGVNFSRSYAEYLGLDWQKTYQEILNDLQPKKIRLAAPWNEIEPINNIYDFSDLDWQIEKATEKKMEIVLIIGRRTPHWPECHDPSWLKGRSKFWVEQQQLEMLKTVVNRYKNNEQIKVWQVENEPLLDSFGQCPPGNPDLLQKEISLVRNLDDRPILITDSGELSLWLPAAQMGDLFGTTLYKVVYNKWTQYTFYYLPPTFYRFKALLAGIEPEKVIISELQAEPWAPQGILQTPLNEQKISMDEKRLKNHISYAQKTGFTSAYLWGAEWWYWLNQKKNDPSLWRTAKQEFIKFNN